MHDFLLTDDERRLRGEVRDFSAALQARARTSERDGSWEPLHEAVRLTGQAG